MAKSSYMRLQTMFTDCSIDNTVLTIRNWDNPCKLLRAMIAGHGGAQIQIGNGPRVWVNSLHLNW